MTAIRVRHVGFAHGGAAFQLEDIELHLARGWTGVVGANGSGKTTLVRLLSGDLRPDTGTIIREPRDARLHVCAQVVESVSADIQSLAGSTAPRARRLIGELGLDPEQIARWGVLSPGERKRWQIGAALAAEYDALLLDEPTNHLDAAARDRVLQALARYDGIGVIVSHDRSVLDALTTHTLRLHAGRVQSWPGRYSDARRDWIAEDLARLDEHVRTRQSRDSAKQLLGDARRKHGQAERLRSSSARMKSPLDHDARGALAKGRAANGAAALSRTVATARERVRTLDVRLESLRIEKDPGRTISFDCEPAPRRRLFQLEADAVFAGERCVLRRVNLAVERDDRIHLRGHNGTGKSTLLRRMMQAASLPESKCLFVPQEIDPQRGVELVREVAGLRAAEKSQVLSLYAALGSEPAALMASAHPSPGEARKLWIALGLGRRVWALVLDEPTNHLDLPSIERLESALAQYRGALVLVTHDDAFAQRCTRTRWDITEGRVHVT